MGIDKYYTPTIEEFHVGFECEVDDLHDNLKDRCFRPIKVDWSFMDIICDDWEHKYKDFGSLYRVKHLDAADIEECGFKRSGLDKNLYSILWIDDADQEKNAVWLTDFNNGRYQITDCRAKWHFVLFAGTIKNKSELKRLMKQLGIWE